MRVCPVDGTPLSGRADQRYCSERCSKKARRQQAVVPLRTPDAPRTERPSLAASVLKDLQAAGKESSTLGVAALLLAERLDGGQEPGSMHTQLNKELRATLAEALKGSAKSSVTAMRDELAERRRQA